MREIKFRAWDTLYSELIYDVQFRRDDRTFDNFLDSRYALMQFTGLRDKNNVPVYEGDIVKGEAKDPFVIVPMLGGLSMHNINNLGQEHNELISMPTNDAQTASWLEESIVIGNIYENPELLSNP